MASSEEDGAISGTDWGEDWLPLADRCM